MKKERKKTRATETVNMVFTPELKLMAQELALKKQTTLTGLLKSLLMQEIEKENRAA